MKVVITRSFGTYRRGQMFDWQPSFARILISRGLIEPIEIIDDIETTQMPAAEGVRTATKKTTKRKRATK